MSEGIFLRLGERWALGADSLQWVVYRRRLSRKTGAEGWEPVSFVASERRIFDRVLREKGAEVTPQTRAALDAMPATFQEWIAERDREPVRAAA